MRGNFQIHGVLKRKKKKAQSGVVVQDGRDKIYLPNLKI